MAWCTDPHDISVYLRDFRFKGEGGMKQAGKGKSCVFNKYNTAGLCRDKKKIVN